MTAVFALLLAIASFVGSVGAVGTTLELAKCSDNTFGSCTTIDDSTVDPFDPKTDVYYKLSISGLSTAARGIFSLQTAFSVVADGIDTNSIFPFSAGNEVLSTASGRLDFKLTLSTAVSGRLQFKVKSPLTPWTESDQAKIATALPLNSDGTTPSGITAGIRLAFRPVFKFGYDQFCTKFDELADTASFKVDDLTRIASGRQSLKFNRPYTTDTVYLCVEGLLGFGADIKNLPLSKVAKVRYDQLIVSDTPDTAVYKPLATDSADDASSFFSTFNNVPVRVDNGVVVYALKPSDAGGVPPGQYSFFAPKDFLTNKAGMRNLPSKGAAGADTGDGSHKRKFTLFVNMTVHVIPSVSLAGLVAPGADASTTSNTLSVDGALVAAPAVKAASALIFSSGKLPEGSYELQTREIYTNFPTAPQSVNEITYQTDPAPASATIALKVTMPASKWVLSRLRNVAGVAAFFTKFGLYDTSKYVVDPSDVYVDDGRIAGPGMVSLIYTTSLPARANSLVAFAGGASSAKRVLGPLYMLDLNVPVAWQPRLTFWYGTSNSLAKQVKAGSKISPSSAWIGVRLYADYGLSANYFDQNSPTTLLRPSFSVFNVYGPPGPGGQPLIIAAHAASEASASNAIQRVRPTSGNADYNYEGRPSDASAAEYLEWRLAISSNTVPGKYVFQLPYNRILDKAGSKNVFVNATLTLGQTASLTSAIFDTSLRAFLVRVEQPLTCVGVPTLPFEVEVQIPCTPSSSSSGTPDADRTDFYRSDVCKRAMTENDGYTRELYKCNANANPAVTAESCAVKTPAPTCGLLDPSDLNSATVFKLRGRSQMAPASGADIVVVRIPPNVWDFLQDKIKTEAADTSITANNVDVTSGTTFSTVITFVVYQSKLNKDIDTSPTGSTMSLTLGRLTERFGKNRIWKTINTPDLVTVSVDNAWNDYLSNRPRNVAYDGASTSIPDGRAAVPPTAMALVSSPSTSVVGVELQMQSVCSNKGVMVLSQVQCNAAPVAMLRADKTDMTFSATASDMLVVLDSRGTIDPDGDAISVTYFLVSKPEASTLQAATQFAAYKYKYKSPSDPTGKTMITIYNNSIVSFTPDMGGRFVVGMNVTDGCSTSTATVTIDVACPPTSVAMVSLMGVTESYDGGNRPDATGTTGGDTLKTWKYKISAPLSEYFQDGVSKLAYDWSIKAVRPYARSVDYAVGFWGFEPPPPGSNEWDVVPVTMGSATKREEGTAQDPITVKDYDCYSLGSVSSLTTTLTFSTSSAFASSSLGYRSKDYGVSGYGYLAEKIGQSETATSEYPSAFQKAASGDVPSGSTGVRTGHRLSVSSSAALQLGSTRQLSLEGLKQLDKITIKFKKNTGRTADITIPASTVACRVPLLVSLRVYDSCSRQYANDSLWIEQPACGAPPVSIAGASVVALSEPAKTSADNAATVTWGSAFPTVYLDGSGSYDPDTPSDRLYYTWIGRNDAAVKAFSTSIAAVTGITGKSKTGQAGRAVKFTPTKPGIYTFGLMVSDGCPRAQQVISNVTVYAVCRAVAAGVAVTTSDTTAKVTTIKAGEEYSVPVQTQIKLKAVSSPTDDSVSTSTTVVSDFGPVGAKSRSLSSLVGADSSALVDPTSLRVFSGTAAWNYKIELLSKPEGSATTATASGFVSASELNLASGLDRPGQYVFRVTIVDNCNKDSAAIVRLIKITATCAVPTVFAGAVVRTVETSTFPPTLPLSKSGACKPISYYDFITGTADVENVPEHLVLTKTINLWYRGYDSGASTTNFDKNRGFPMVILGAYGTKYGSSAIVDSSNVQLDRYAVSWVSSDPGTFGSGDKIKLALAKIPGGTKSYNFTATVVEAGSCPAYSATVYVNANCNPATLVTEIAAEYDTTYTFTNADSTTTQKNVPRVWQVASFSNCASEGTITKVLFDGFAGTYPNVKVKVTGTYQEDVIEFTKGSSSVPDKAKLTSKWPYSEKKSEFVWNKFLCPDANRVFSSTVLAASSPAGYAVQTDKYTTEGADPQALTPRISLDDKMVPITFNWTSSDGCIAGRRGSATILPTCPDFKVSLVPKECGKDLSEWDYVNKRFKPVELQVSAKYTDPLYLKETSAVDLARFPARKVGAVAKSSAGINNVKVSVVYDSLNTPLKKLLAAAVPMLMRHKADSTSASYRVRRLAMIDTPSSDLYPSGYMPIDNTNLATAPEATSLDTMKYLRMTIDLSDPATSTALALPCSSSASSMVPFASSLLDQGIVNFEANQGLAAVTYFFVTSDPDPAIPQQAKQTITFDTCPDSRNDASLGVMPGLPRTSPLFNKPIQTPMKLRLYSVPPTGTMLEAPMISPLPINTTSSTCTIKSKSLQGDGSYITETVGINSLSVTGLSRGLYILVASYDTTATPLEYPSSIIPRPSNAALFQAALKSLTVNVRFSDTPSTMRLQFFNYKSETTANSLLTELFANTDSELSLLLSTYFGKAGTRAALASHIFTAQAAGDYPATQAVSVLPATVGTHSYKAAVTDGCSTSYSEPATVVAKCKAMRVEAYTLVGSYSPGVGTALQFNPASSLGTKTSITAKKGIFPDVGLLVVPYYQDTKTTFLTDTGYTLLPTGFLNGQYITMNYQGRFVKKGGTSADAKELPPYAFIDPFASPPQSLFVPFKPYMRYFRPIGEGTYTFNVSATDGCATASSCTDFSLTFTCDTFSATSATYAAPATIVLEAWANTPNDVLSGTLRTGGSAINGPVTGTIWPLQDNGGNGYFLEYKYDLPNAPATGTPLTMEPKKGYLSLAAEVKRGGQAVPEFSGLSFAYLPNPAAPQPRFYTPVPTENLEVGLYKSTTTSFGGLGVFFDADSDPTNDIFTKFSYFPFVEGTHTLTPRINDGCVQQTAPAIIIKTTCPYKLTYSPFTGRPSLADRTVILAMDTMTTARFDFPKAFKTDQTSELATPPPVQPTMCVARYNQIPATRPGHAVFTVELVSRPFGAADSDLPTLDCRDGSNQPATLEDLSGNAGSNDLGCRGRSTTNMLRQFSVTAKTYTYTDPDDSSITETRVKTPFGQYVYKATTFDGCKSVSTTFTVTIIQRKLIPTFDFNRYAVRTIDPTDPSSVRPASLTDTRSACRNYPVIRITADKGLTAATPLGLNSGKTAWDTLVLSAETSYLVADYRSLASSKPSILPFVQFDIISAPATSRYAKIDSSGTGSDRFKGTFTPDVTGKYTILVTGASAKSDGRPDFGVTPVAKTIIGSVTYKPYEATCGVGIAMIDIYADCGSATDCQGIFPTVTTKPGACSGSRDLATLLPSATNALFVPTNPVSMRRDTELTFTSFFAGYKNYLYGDSNGDRYFYYPTRYDYAYPAASATTVFTRFSDFNNANADLGYLELECMDFSAHVVDWDLPKGGGPQQTSTTAAGISSSAVLATPAGTLSASFTGSVTGSKFVLPEKRFSEFYVFALKLSDGCYTTHATFTITTTCGSNTGVLTLTSPASAAATSWLGTYYPPTDRSVVTSTVTLKAPDGQPAAGSPLSLFDSGTSKYNAYISAVTTPAGVDDLDVYFSTSQLFFSSNHPRNAPGDVTRNYRVSFSDMCQTYDGGQATFTLSCTNGITVSTMVEEESLDSKFLLTYSTPAGANMVSATEYKSTYTGPGGTQRWQPVRFKLNPSDATYRIAGATWTLTFTTDERFAPLGVDPKKPYIFTTDNMYAYFEPLQEGTFKITGKLAKDPCYPTASAPAAAEFTYTAQCKSGAGTDIGTCGVLTDDPCPFSPLLQVQATTDTSVAAQDFSSPFPTLTYKIPAAFLASGVYETVSITTLGSGMVNATGSTLPLGFDQGYSYVPISFYGVDKTGAYSTFYDRLVSVTDDYSASVFPTFSGADDFFGVYVGLASYKKDSITDTCAYTSIYLKITKSCAFGTCVCGNLLVDPFVTTRKADGSLDATITATQAVSAVYVDGATSMTRSYKVNWVTVTRDTTVAPPIYYGFFPPVKIETNKFLTNSLSYDPTVTDPVADYSDRNGRIGRTYPSARISLVSAPKSSFLYALSNDYFVSLNNSFGSVSTVSNITFASFIDGTDNSISFRPDAVGEYVFAVDQDVPQDQAIGCASTRTTVKLMAVLTDSEAGNFPVTMPYSGKPADCPNRYELEILLPSPSVWPTVTISDAATDAMFKGGITAYVSSWNNRSNYIPVPFTFRVTGFDTYSGQAFDVLDPMSAPQLTLEMAAASVPYTVDDNGYSASSAGSQAGLVFGAAALTQSLLTNSSINTTTPSVFTGTGWNFPDADSFAPLGLAAFNIRSYKGHPLVSASPDYLSGNLALLKSSFVVLPDEPAKLATKFIVVNVRLRDSFGCASSVQTFFVAPNCLKQAPVPGYLEYYPNGCRTQTCKYFMTLSPTVRVGSNAPVTLPAATPGAPAASSNVTLRYDSTKGYYQPLVIDMKLPAMLKTYDATTGKEIVGSSPAYSSIKYRVASVIQRPPGATDKDYVLRASHENQPLINTATNQPYPRLAMTDMPISTTTDVRKGFPLKYFAYGGALTYTGFQNRIMKQQSKVSSTFTCIDPNNVDGSGNAAPCNVGEWVDSGASVSGSCADCYSSGGAPLLEFYSAVPGRYVIEIRLYFDKTNEGCYATRQITVDVVASGTFGVVTIPNAVNPKAAGSSLTLSGTECAEQVAKRKAAGVSCQCDQVTVALQPSAVSVWKGPHTLNPTTGAIDIKNGWSRVDVDFQNGTVAKDGCADNTKTMPCANYPFNQDVTPRIVALSIPPLRAGVSVAPSLSLDATFQLDGSSKPDFTKVALAEPSVDLGPGTYKLGFIAGHRNTFITDVNACPAITGLGFLEARCPTLKARPKFIYGSTPSYIPALLDSNKAPDAPDNYKDFTGNSIRVQLPLNSLDGRAFKLDASSSIAIDPVDGTKRKVILTGATTATAHRIKSVLWEVVSEPKNPLEVGGPSSLLLDPSIRTHLVENIRAKSPSAGQLTVYGKGGSGYSLGTDLLPATAPDNVAKQLAAGTPAESSKVTTADITFRYYGRHVIMLTIDDGCSTSVVTINIDVECEPLPASYISNMMIDITTLKWDTTLGKTTYKVDGTVDQQFLLPDFSQTYYKQCSPAGQGNCNAQGVTIDNTIEYVKPMVDSRGNQLAYMMPYRGKPYKYSLSASLRGPALNSSDPSLTCDANSNPSAAGSLFFAWYVKVPQAAAPGYYYKYLPTKLDTDGTIPPTPAADTSFASLLTDTAEISRLSLSAASMASMNGFAADRNVVEYAAVAMSVCRLPFVRNFKVGMACQPLPVWVDTSFTRAGIWMPLTATSSDVSLQLNNDVMPRARIMLGTDTRATMLNNAGTPVKARYMIRGYWKLVSSPAESRFNPANLPTGCSYSQVDTDADNKGLEVEYASAYATLGFKTGLSIVHTCTAAGSGLRQAAMPILELTYKWRDATSTDEVVKNKDTQVARLLADVPGTYTFEVTVTDGCGSNTTMVTMRMDCAQLLPAIPAGSPKAFVYKGDSTTQAAVNTFGDSMTIHPVTGAKVSSGSAALWSAGSLDVDVTATVLNTTGSTMAANLVSSTMPVATFFAELSRNTGMPEEFPMITLPGVSSIAAMVMGGAANQIPDSAVSMLSDTVKNKALPSLQADLMPVQVEWTVVSAPDASRYSLKQALRKADDAEGNPMRFLPMPIPLTVTGGSSGYRLSRAVRETMVNVNINTTATSMATTGRVILAHSNSPRLDFQPDVPGTFIIEAVAQDDCPARMTGASNTATVDSPSASNLMRGLKVPTLAASTTVVRHVIVSKCNGSLMLEMPSGVNRTVSLSGESFQNVQILSNFEGDFSNVYLADGTRPGLVDVKAMAANATGAAALIERSPLKGLHISAGSHVKGRWSVVLAPRNMDPRSVQLNNAHSIYGASFLPRAVGVYHLRLDIWDVRCGPMSMKSRIVRLVVDCPADIVEARIDTMWISHGGSGFNISDASQMVWKQNSTLLARVVGQYRLSDADVAVKSPVKYTWQAVTNEGLAARRRKGDATALAAQSIAVPPAPPAASGLNAGQIVAIVFGSLGIVAVAFYAYKTGTDAEFRGKQTRFLGLAGQRVKQLSQRALTTVTAVSDKPASRNSAKEVPTIVTDSPASVLAASGMAKAGALTTMTAKIREEEEEDKLTEEEKRKLEEANPLKNLDVQNRYGNKRTNRASLTGALGGPAMITNPIGSGAAGTGLEETSGPSRKGRQSAVEVTGFEPVRDASAVSASSGMVENPLRPKRLVSLKDPVASVVGGAPSYGAGAGALPGVAEEEGTEY